MINKKIRNATVCKSGNIIFKSKLEKMAYDYLLRQGFNPKYEPETFTLIEPFESVTPFFDRETKSQYDRRKKKGDFSPVKLVEKGRKIQGIKYTPDLYFNYKGIDVFIEMKSIENDVFYIKKKLFRKYLDNRGTDSVYFEIYTKTQLEQAVEIIRKYGELRENKGTGRFSS